MTADDRIRVTLQRNGAPLSLTLSPAAPPSMTLPKGVTAADLPKMAERLTAEYLAVYSAAALPAVMAVIPPPKPARQEVDYDDDSRVREVRELAPEPPSAAVAATVVAAVADKLRPVIRKAYYDGALAALPTERRTR